MTSFGDDRPSVVAKRPNAQALELPSADTLAAISEEARLIGYDEGHSAGYGDGLAIGRAEAAHELEHLQSIALSFSTALAAADESIASDLLELALQLSRAMLRQALEVKPELIIPVIREAIEYLPVLQQPALLMLNPADAQIVRDGIGEELDKGGWRLIEDAQVGRGGCRIDTASNQIDAQASARWQRLSNSLGKNVDWLGP
jgi:flagellar assembly protein FliH